MAGVAEFGAHRRCDEHALCEQFLEVFTAADADGLAAMIEHAQLGVFLIASVARVARKLDMKDIQATVVIAEEEEKEKEAEKEEAKKAAMEEVTDEQLQSDMANVQIDDE